MRRLAPKLALLLGTLLLIFTVGEIAARIITFRDAAAADDARAAVAQAGDEDLPVLTDIFEIARKNVRGIYQGVPYRTNSQGVRGPDYSPRPAPGTFRILVTGDSVTMGWGVTEDDAYPARLARLLNASGDGRRYEVVNVGLAGINALFANQRLARLGDVYHPDLVVYGFTLNDIEGPHYVRTLTPEVKAQRREARQATWRRALRFNDSPSYLLRQLWPRWVMVREWDVFHGDDEERVALQADEWHRNYFQNPPAWKDFVSGLDVLAGYARANGICGVVLIHTHLTELGPEHPNRAVYERVAAAARARGLTVAESLSYFLGRRDEDLWVNAFDVHPNPEAHRILATALLEGLRGLPPACWRTADERRVDVAGPLPDPGEAITPAGIRSPSDAR